MLRSAVKGQERKDSFLHRYHIAKKSEKQKGSLNKALFCNSGSPREIVIN